MQNSGWGCYNASVMDFSVRTIKGLASEAATVFTRAVQYTEEKLGTSERTELDGHYDNLASRADKTKHWTERILARTEAVLQPNPNCRLEDYVFEKLQDKKRDRMTNLEQLGQDMLDAGIDLGPGTAYGTALIRIGQAEQKLGLAEREFVKGAVHGLVQPLRSFLEGDMKTITKERKILENKRLDLDICKNRLRKARSMEAQANTKPEMILKEIEQAEKELRIAQSEFDRQAEITKLLLEGISSAHANHLRCLNDFVEAQAKFYAQCQQHMIDLQKELAGMSVSNIPGGQPAVSFQNVKLSSPESVPLTGGGSSPTSTTEKKRARVLYDYEAHDSSELSLVADEVIMVSQYSGGDADWMLGERGALKGKVPVAYLEILQ